MYLLRWFLISGMLQYASCQDECLPVATETRSLGDFTLSVTGTDLQFTLDKNGGSESHLTGSLGVNLPSVFGQPTECNGDSNICWNWGSSAQVSIERADDGVCYDVTWTVSGLTSIRDCFDVGQSHWYSGGVEYRQHFPLSPDHVTESMPYVTGDLFLKKIGGVAEPWWVNSAGGGLWVPPLGVPLFYRWNVNNDQLMCLEAKYEAPYVKADDSLRLTYKMCGRENAKEMQLHAIANFLGKPDSVPDDLMFRRPIWSTWARYKADINESTVTAFASEIVDNNFGNSQLEIDDNWESCYGDAEFNTQRFPDPANMVQKLKDQGFRVTLWIHPFVNVTCDSWLEGAKLGHFIKDRNDAAQNLPGLTPWWQGDMASYIDFTSSGAVDWWAARLDDLRTKYGIDSFKFDAGETNYLPTAYALQGEGDKSKWPHSFSPAYVEAVSARFGGMIEVRVGLRSQSTPVFVRMLDKETKWGYDNGLKTLVTTLLQMGIAGYPFVLPDMIGGNGYGPGVDITAESNMPSKELFVRWMQANVFMPTMQFSYVPWDYDQEVIELARNLTSLHEQYSDLILELAHQATSNGIPINRPIWWNDPNDQDALGVDSEFLLGDELLVAPVLEEGATSRDIYLPLGTWRSEFEDGNPEYEGRQWLRDVTADLVTLPYYTKVADSAQFSCAPRRASLPFFP